MQHNRHIGVIFGGRSGEHEVSLASARSILAALDPQKYTVTQIGITKDGVWLGSSGKENVLDAFLKGDTSALVPVTLLPDPTHPNVYTVKHKSNTDSAQGEDVVRYLSSLDVVFPVLHGTYGEDGTLQGLLELNSIAYVGAGVVGSAVGMDKGIFKDVMRAHNLPVLDWTVVTRSVIEQDLDRAIQQALAVAPFPLFVKPANLGSSVGISKCSSRADLVEGLMDAARYDRRVIIERGIQAREIEISVLGNEDAIVSEPGEIIPSREFYSYEAKYIDNRSELIIPASLPVETVRKIKELAILAYRIIDCAGMARVDFFLDKKDGNLFISELNTIPGFTQISMYPKLWEASGILYSQLVDRLIELALQRKAERDHTIYKRMDN
jgi:D-alanine-D-alanine ligase